MSLNRLIYETWSLIQDIIGDKSLWPKDIRKIFWKKNKGHWERIRLAGINWINGVNPEIFQEWIIMTNLLDKKSAR